MIRVIKVVSGGKSSGRYYSLWDISLKLTEQGVIDKQRCAAFYDAAQRRISATLRRALWDKYIMGGDEPLIIGLNDWFVYWCAWGQILSLLPKAARNHEFTRFLFSEIDFEEGILHKERYSLHFAPTTIVNVPEKFQWA